MSHLKKVDHITYACEHGAIEKWAWFHIEIEGGTLINRIDDVRPEDPDSSMKIWCVDYGDFGIALVEGIDRSKKSHVTRFVERHGDHACQHVAFDCRDLERFREQLLRSGCHPRGAVLVRHDGFGLLKQLFAKGYAPGDPTEASFAEYVERPRADDKSLHITFSQDAGRSFYEQIENAFAAGDDEPFIDFSRMPSDWRVPAPQPRPEPGWRPGTQRATSSRPNRSAT